MQLHELKCYPQYFQAVKDRRKNFEVRKNDRDFKVGDFLWLREYDGDKLAFTGREETRRITYILDDYFAVAEDHVVLAMEPVY